MRANLIHLIANVTAIVTVPLLLALSMDTSQAAPGQFQSSGAAQLGLSFGTSQGGLFVRSAGMTNLGLRAGDQIIAVNGRRVATEAAFMNRLTLSKSGARGVTISVVRNSRIQILTVPAGGGTFTGTTTAGGFMNPALMVMTSQGVMHRDTAARLGLPGTPITGTPEWPEHPQTSR